MSALISLSTQLASLARKFPDGSGRIAHNELRWRQTILPHLLAHTYTCELTYKVGGFPKISCLDPNLVELAGGRQLPHVYTREHPVRLCLFFANESNWNDRKLLSDAVVPLAYGWLAYFEDWLFSGVWRGTGTHPIPAQPPATLPFPGESQPSAA